MKFATFWIVAAGLCLWMSIAHAGRVRTLYTNDRIMQPIFLAMGRSTILRFDEKPKNVVIGNQNYFAVEYLGNDVTIQPQGITTTNIFVYTESQTYGLILKVGSEAQYDDLVFVRWKPGYVSIESEGLGKQKSVTALVSSTLLHQKMELKDSVRLEILKLIRSVAQGISIFEFIIENVSSESINTKDITLSVGTFEKSLPTQTLIIKQDLLKPNEKTEARIFVRKEKIESAELDLSFKGKTTKLILAKRFFK